MGAVPEPDLQGSARLERAGYATRRQVEQSQRPDKGLYRVTDAGRAALAEWVQEVDEDPDGGIGVFLLKVFFGWAAPPDAALAQVGAYRRLLERRLGHYEEMDRDLSDDEPVHSRIALRHGIARTRATLQWAEEARRLLEHAAGADGERGLDSPPGGGSILCLVKSRPKECCRSAASPGSAG